MTLILSIISLAYMFFTLIYYVVRYLRVDRAGKYTQLKSFRKGTFGLIYLGAIPLYFAGNLHNGCNLIQAIFDSISNALSLIFLSFKWEVVIPLSRVDVFYMISIYICFTIAIFNAGIFTFTLLAYRLRNRRLLSRIEKGDGSVCIIVGYNERTRQLIESLKDGDYSILLLAPKSDAVKELAFIHNFATLKFSYTNDILPIVKKYASRTDKRMVRMIVNTENEETNFLLATAIAEHSVSLGSEHFSIDGKFGFSAYVFGSDVSESSFIRLSEKTHGCVQCVNRHKRLALDFIEKHPITDQLKKDDVDPETLCIKPDITFNFIMIGFGGLSRHILRSHSINSQLLQIKDGIPCPKTVHYSIYDVREAEKDKNLNHNLLRYSAWYKKSSREECYPVPQSMFDIKYHHMNIEDGLFYESLYNDLTRIHPSSKDTDSATPTEAELNGLRNSIIISCDTDLINVDFAEKLLEKLREWKLDDRTKIFVRIRDDKIREKVIGSTYPNGEIIAFGSENEIIGSAHAIFAEGADFMAKQQHLNYTRTDNADRSEGEIRELAIKSWYDKLTYTQRESNVYACLSVRVKLQLLGFDIAELDDPRPDAAKSFIDSYFQGVERENGIPRTYSEKELSDYTVRRHMMTRMEHQRWNAYMICCGYVPAVPDEYLNQTKQELHSIRKHANIVTFEELIHQRKVISAHRGCSEAEADVIKYDYRLTDFLPELLTECNLKIVQKEY